MGETTLRSIVMGQTYQLDNTYGYDFFDRAYIQINGLSSDSTISVDFYTDEYMLDATGARITFDVYSIYAAEIGIGVIQDILDVSLADLLSYAVRILDFYYAQQENSPILLERSIKFIVLS